jgi:hypothetical protein
VGETLVYAWSPAGLFLFQQQMAHIQPRYCPRNPQVLYKKAKSLRYNDKRKTACGTFLHSTTHARAFRRSNLSRALDECLVWRLLLLPRSTGQYLNEKLLLRLKLPENADVILMEIKYKSNMRVIYLVDYDITD